MFEKNKWIKLNELQIINKIQEINGGRKDYKIDCLAAEFKDWEISWNKKNK